MDRRLILAAVLVFVLIITVSASSVIRPHAYLNNPDMLIAGIETEASITAGEAGDVTIMINVTNGDGVNGLGTWSPGIDLWSVGSPAAGPDISAWTETEMLSGNFLCGAVGDFDNDGDADFVGGTDLGVVYMAENPESADINDWTGSQVVVGVQLNSIAVGDFNFDGNLDVVVGDNVGSVYLYENPGSVDISTWAPATTLLVAPGSLDDMDVGDLDNDGDLDIIAATIVGPAGFLISIENPGTDAMDISTWTAYNIAGNIATINSLAIGDFDGDEDIDAVIGSTNLDMFESDGTVDVAGWTLTTVAAPGDTYALAVADFDDDGDLDMISGDDSTDISIWENPDSADITTWITTSTGVALYDNILSLDVGDIDGDGDIDVAGGTVAVVATSAVYTFNNPGSVDATTWSSSVVLDTAGNIWGTALADFDLNGDLDLLLTGDSSEIDIFENTEVTVTAVTNTATDPLTNMSAAQIDLTVSWTPPSAGTYSLLAAVDNAHALTDPIRSNNRLTLNGISVTAEEEEEDEEESSSSSNNAGPATTAATATADLTVAGEVNIVLGQGQQTSFTVGGSVHTVQVTEVGTSSADFIVSSEPQAFSLEVGGSKELDLDADSVNDIIVKFDSIIGGKVKFTIVEAVAEQPAGQSALQQESGGMNGWWIISLVSICIIGALLIVFRKKLKIFNR